MGTKVNIIVGSHVWAEDPGICWVDGEVVKINGEEAEIQAINGKKIIANSSKLYPKDMEAAAGGVDDMTKLSYVHEPGVLQNLAIRYELNAIYTYTGNILIAVNPFQRLPHLYDPHMMQQYKGAPFGELSPHVFAVADVAYRSADNLFKEAKTKLDSLNGIIYSNIIHAHCQCGNMDRAEELVREMEEDGIDAPIDVYHSMMHGYTTIQDEKKCLIVFERLKV